MNQERNGCNGKDWEVNLFADYMKILADLDKVMNSLLKASKQ